MSYLIKLNRLSAWLLVFLMIIYFLTGFDALKNLWQPDFSRYLHNKILPLPSIILFFFHILVGLKMFLLRQKLENKFLNTLLFSAAAILFLLFFYIFLR